MNAAQNIVDQLSLLGLCRKESDVYLCLAEFGRASVQQVARHARLPRTTAHFILRNLVERRIIVAEKKRGSTFYSAREPKVFAQLLKEEHSALARKIRKAEELEPALRPFFRNRLFSVPTLQFFEGKEAVQRMCFDYIDDWHASMMEHDNTWWGYQDHEFVVEYRAFLEHYWRMKDKRQRILIFSNESDLEKNLRVSNRIIRAVPPGFHFSSTVWVCGAFVIVVMHKNKPQYAFQIKDRVLGTNLKVVFELLWSLTNESK